MDKPEEGSSTPSHRGRPLSPSSARDSLLVITAVPDAAIHSIPPTMEGIFGFMKRAMGDFNETETVDPKAAAGVEKLCVIINTLVRMVGEKDDEASKAIESLTDRLTHAMIAKAALKIEAFKDKLTEIANQAALLEFGPKLFERAKAAGKPLSCLMLDLDFFKKVNDTYGHDAGDNVLMQFAQRMKEVLRTSDFLSRMTSEEESEPAGADQQGELFDIVTRAGGEEFCVVLAGTALEGACIAAERVREAMDSRPFFIKDSAGHDQQLHLTLSIGVAEAKFEPGATFGQLRKQSDMALYFAKEDGRNAVGKIETDESGQQVFNVVSPKERFRPKK